MENQQNFSYDLELGTIEEGNEDEPLRESVGDNEDKPSPTQKIRNRIESSTNANLEKFEKAYRNGRFEEFRNLLSHTYYVQKPKISLKKQTSLFDSRPERGSSLFEEILSSKKDKSSKYISLVLSFYNLWDDEDFLAKENQQKNTMMAYVVQSRNIKSLLSFLVPDWFDHETTRARFYSLALKSRQFKQETNKNLLERLYELIDDNESKIFQEIILRIIYQYFYELDEEREISAVFSESEDILNIRKVFKIKSQEHKEKILQVLAVFWTSTVDSKIEYNKFKDKTLKALQSDEQKAFFNLAFMLKEKQIIKFQKEFEDYIKKSQKIYGEYFKIILKPLVRLLFKITSRQKMFKTGNFIFQKYPYIEVNSTIMKSFYDVQDFKVFNIYPFKSRKLADLHKQLANRSFSPEDLLQLERLLQKDDTSDDTRKRELKRFVFGRNVFNQGNFNESIFERILATPMIFDLDDTDKISLIELIWNKFELSTKEEILSLKNPQGKYLLDYVLESKDDLNLLNFLMPKLPNVPKFTKRCHFLKMQNDQFLALANKTLFEHYLCISTSGYLGTKIFPVMFSLLEEISLIEDIQTEVPIDKILEWATNEKYYMNLLNLEMDYEDEEMIEEMKRKRYYIDDLLGNIIAYWSPKDVNYDFYKEKLLELGPFFDMIFDVIEDEKEQHFSDNFLNRLELLEASFRTRYVLEDSVEHYTTSFLFILLLTAMLKDRRKVIDQILNYETFETVKLKFPSNMRSNESSQYVAQKLLEHGHEIGKKEIPSSWISQKMFKDFLDSRIRYENEDLTELDCSFLLHGHTKKYQIESAEDVDNKIVFWEDTNSLDFIMQSESLKESLTHPVVSTYIELKTLKYRNLFLWNFWAFVGIFVIPFGALILLPSDYTSIVKYICCVSIAYLVTREVFQLLFVVASKQYFRKKSNWLEIALINVSMLNLVCNPCHVFGFKMLPVLEVTLIFLITIILLTMLPLQTMSLHMKMLGRVLRSFFKFLAIFALILIAFSVSFGVIFSIKSDVKPQPIAFTCKYSNSSESYFNETVNDISSNTSGISSTISSPTTNDFNNTAEKPDNTEFTENFTSIQTAILKVILMMNGEYTVEPWKLDGWFQLLICFSFVFSTFILVNLIQGLTFDDVQKLRERARYLMIKQKARKFIETSQKCFEVYRGFELDEEEDQQSLKLWQQFTVWFLKGRITKYPFLHKIDKVYVNMKTREMTLEINRKQKVIADKTISKDVLKSIKEILSERNNGKDSEEN